MEWRGVRVYRVEAARPSGLLHTIPSQGDPHSHAATEMPGSQPVKPESEDRIHTRRGKRGERHQEASPSRSQVKDEIEGQEQHQQHRQ